MITSEQAQYLKSLDNYHFDEHIRDSITANKFEYLRDILITHDFYFHRSVHSLLNFILINACNTGNFDIVKFVLTSHELKQHADINCSDDQAFRNTCSYGHYEITQYLLSSTDLKTHAKIDANFNEGISTACARGDLKLVEYLLTSTELKKHASVYDFSSKPFQKAHEFKREHILNYLIFDYNIKVAGYIEFYISDKSDLLKMFKLRDLNQLLNNNLNNDKEIKVKNKI